MTRKATPNEKPAITVTVGVDSPFLLYAGDDEKVHVRVFIHAETLWLPQRLMAELFHTTPDNIGLHLKNIYAEGELAEPATAEDFSVVQNEGGRAVRRTQRQYSLDAIIAVGYRVSSRRATQVRIWATRILNEYIRKGFVLDDPTLALRVFLSFVTYLQSTNIWNILTGPCATTPTPNASLIWPAREARCAPATLMPSAPPG